MGTYDEKHWMTTYDKQYRMIKTYLNLLKNQRVTEVGEVGDITVCPCEYKTGNTPPPAENFKPFSKGDYF